MLVAVLGALFIYSQQQSLGRQRMVTEVQNDVRCSMFFLSRDLRMAGAGLPEEFSGYFIEGEDNEDQGAGDVLPDRVTIMGNIEVPLNLPLRNYQGSSVTLSIEDFSFEQYSYPDAFYDNKFVLVLPNPESGCRAARLAYLPGPTLGGRSGRGLQLSPGQAPGVTRRAGCPGLVPAPMTRRGHGLLHQRQGVLA